MDENIQMKQETEINIGEVVALLLHRWWIILLSGVIFALAFFIHSEFAVTPMYTSSTKVYILNRQDLTKLTYNDLQTGTQLTNDYEELIKSRTVTEQVITDLNLNISSSALAKSLSVSSPTDTRIVVISVTYPDPALARDIANAVRVIASQQIQEIMDIDAVNVVEEANTPIGPSSPDVKRNTLIGGMVGVALAGLVIVLLNLLNDSIRTSEDVEKYLRLSVLACLPLIKEDALKNK